MMNSTGELLGNLESVFIVNDKAEYSDRDQKGTGQLENSWVGMAGLLVMVSIPLIKNKNKMWQIPGGVHLLQSNGSNLCSSFPLSGHR